MLCNDIASYLSFWQFAEQTIESLNANRWFDDIQFAIARDPIANAPG